MQALLIAPDHPDALDHLGMVRAHQLQFEEAHALFGNVVLLQRDFAEGYTSRGLVHLLQGKAARAVRGFEKAIALDPRSMPYRRDLEQAKGVVRNSRSQPLTRRAR